MHGASPAGSDKSNDTARLSFSMNRSEDGNGEEEVTITGTDGLGTNELDNDNDIDIGNIGAAGAVRNRLDTSIATTTATAAA